MTATSQLQLQLKELFTAKLTNGNDGANDPEDDAHDVDDNRTLLRLLVKYTIGKTYVSCIHK